MEVVITTHARLQFAAIVEFAEPFYSALGLTRLVEELRIEVNRLAHRQIGPLEPTLMNIGKSHRFILVRHIKIIYYVADDTVFVTDFFDTRQHPRRMQG